MLRSHHHLRGFIQTSLLCEWMLVYAVGYVGAGLFGYSGLRFFETQGGLQTRGDPFGNRDYTEAVGVTSFLSFQTVHNST